MGESKGVKPGDLCRVGRRCLGIVIEGDSLTVRPSDTLHGGYGRRTTSLEALETVLVVSLHTGSTAVVSFEGELILIDGEFLVPLTEAISKEQE